jgi:hypothetical protein
MKPKKIKIEFEITRDMLVCAVYRNLWLWDRELTSKKEAIEYLRELLWFQGLGTATEYARGQKPEDPEKFERAVAIVSKWEGR